MHQLHLKNLGILDLSAKEEQRRSDRESEALVRIARRENIGQTNLGYLSSPQFFNQIQLIHPLPGQPELKKSFECERGITGTNQADCGVLLIAFGKLRC